MNHPGKRHYALYRAFREIGIYNFEINLIELFPCNNQKELTTREGFHIREYDAVNCGYNRVIAGRTIQEWKRDNAEMIAEKKKLYLQKHSKIIPPKSQNHAGRRNARYVCECGSIYLHRHKDKHVQTSEHRHYLQEQEQ